MSNDKKIIVVTYSSGVKAWFKYTLETLEELICNYNWIEDIEIIHPSSNAFLDINHTERDV
tara:strand:+ start:440 stop:622 length:183 start_codon:yes stop_codon:yes gene_type:complete